MSTPNDDSARLELLELKMMDLEVTIQQLNDVVLQQYRDIDQLRTDYASLKKKLDSVNDSGPAPSPGDEVPPHY